MQWGTGIASSVSNEVLIGEDVLFEQLHTSLLSSKGVC